MADYDRGVKYLLDFEESICYIFCKILCLSYKKLYLENRIIYKNEFERLVETVALNDAFEIHTIQRVFERINNYGTD